MADLFAWSTYPCRSTMIGLWQMVAEMTIGGGEIVHQTGEASLAPHRARGLAARGFTPSG